MAKIKVIFGKLHGKIGGTVFRGGEDGYTVASEYNGNPANPRTQLQTDQRGKMNLAGLFSKMTPYMAIAGMGNSRRKARSKFVSNLLKSMTVQPVVGQPGTRRALFNADSLVLSEGVPVQITGSVAFGDTGRTATVSIVVDASVTNLQGKIVVLYYAVEGVWKGCLVKTLEDETQAAFDLSGVAAELDTVKVVAYIIPVIDSGAAARAAFSNVVNNQSGVSVDASFVRALAVAEAYGLSFYAGEAESGL